MQEWYLYKDRGCPRTYLFFLHIQLNENTSFSVAQLSRLVGSRSGEKAAGAVGFKQFGVILFYALSLAGDVVSATRGFPSTQYRNEGVWEGVGEGKDGRDIK